MAKFYVTSGTFHEIVQAEDARTAALWAMHIALEKVVPVDDIEWLSGEQKEDLDIADGLLELDRKIWVSEAGFGRKDSGSFDSITILDEWNQLVMAVSRLESLIQIESPADTQQFAVIA